MAGIYLHVPFCRKACHYCNFHFSVNHRNMPVMTSCMLQELDMRNSYLAGQEISTIYFGGGTPSLLSADTIQQFIDHIYTIYAVSKDPEITLEANPDDLHRENLKAFRAAGVNRLSIGIQSFSDADLLWMNRTHTAQQSVACIQAAVDEGFQRISADLIYGIPGSNNERWQKNLETIIDLGIGHVSCYALTVEEKTALALSVRKGLAAPPDDEVTVDQFNYMKMKLEQAGFRHYELSNFAQPGQESRHNSSYWQGASYLGIGPSAHSFNGHERCWNIANNSLYITSIQEGTPPYECEVLSETDKINECIMISLRTASGINLTSFTERFGEPAYMRLLASLQDPFVHTYTEQTADRVTIKQAGMMLTDSIISRLFFEA
jgi:oxygen-independent coproporphyrinogen-3 oxidase